MGVRGRGEGGEGGEEMAWGRGGTHDRGRVELTRVSLAMGSAGSFATHHFLLQSQAHEEKKHVPKLPSSNGLK